MADKEYIEREAVINRLKQSIEWCKTELEEGEFKRGCIASLRDEIGNIRHNKVIPTVDVVEVVRCKECGHRGTSDCPMVYYSEYEGEYVDPTYDNDFCNRGKRRE